MNFYIKQRVFSWGDKFSIYDEEGNVRYYVEGEVFSFGKKLHLYNLMGDEVAYIEQKVFSLLPKYSVYKNGAKLCEVVKEFTFFKHLYHARELGWEVNGDFFDHTYSIRSGESEVASVAKEWFTFGDAYRIRVSSSEDEIATLAVVLVVDACIEAERD